MNVLFIYTDVSSAIGYSAGIGILSAILKRENHQAKLIHVSNELDYPLDIVRINQDIRAYQPGLICFSATTNQWYFAKQIGQAIKKEFAIPIIVGGPHATADADRIILEPWVDMVCRGEGDNILPEVARRIESKLSIDGVRNLVHRKGDKIIHEPMEMWVSNLDTLPLEDRNIFNYSRIVDTRSGWAEVIVTRGCPYACTYCFNHPLFMMYQEECKLYSGTSLKKRDYVRRRSVDATINMLKELKSNYPHIKGFTFVDDILAVEGEWFEDFAQRMNSEIGLPYVCTSQPLLFSRNVAKLLKESGCKVVKMGIEAGNEQIRKKVLNRNISNQKMIEVFNLAKEFRLKTQAFNMIGIPGETNENMMETIRLNALIKPYVVWVSTFNPYPGTELSKICVGKNMIEQSKWDKIDSYRNDSVLKEEYLPAIAFKKIRVLFRWLLNADLKNDAVDIYRHNIEMLFSLPAEHWQNGTVEKLFQEKDTEIDEYLRKKNISHYVSKKYINIYWDKEYDYDLS